MPNFVLVDDPDYEGTIGPPQILRAWAMRKLFAKGYSVGDIARKYDIPYARAYRAVVVASKVKPTATKKARAPKAPLVPDYSDEDLEKLPEKKLVSFIYQKRPTQAQLELAARASEVADRRFPGWNDRHDR
jgi:hypothetical protein